MLAPASTIDGVNVMTMDFGGSLAGGPVDARRRSARARRRPSSSSSVLYRQAGVTLHAAPGVGAHGRHADDRPERRAGRDVLAERCAARLVAFAHRMHLARVSMWSANRDSQCGVAGRSIGRCRTRAAASSSIRWHSPGSSDGSNGHLPVRTSAPAEAGSRAHADPRRPGHQPVPDLARVRRPTRAGDEIVWHHRVYEAKWYTQGDVPGRAGRPPLGHALALHRPGPLQATRSPRRRAPQHVARVERRPGVPGRQHGAPQRARLPGEVVDAGGRADERSAAPGSSPWQVVGKATHRAARRPR